MDPDDFRELALGFPETVEIETWGHPTFRVRAKIFATMSNDGPTAGVKTTKLEQIALVSAEPETFSVPSYVGRHGWVTIRLDRADSQHVMELVEEAWRQTAPKRLVKVFDADQSA